MQIQDVLESQISNKIKELFKPTKIVVRSKV
jgi:hypothetical protein